MLPSSVTFVLYELSQISLSPADNCVQTAGREGSHDMKTLFVWILVSYSSQSITVIDRFASETECKRVAGTMMEGLFANLPPKCIKAEVAR